MSRMSRNFTSFLGSVAEAKYHGVPVIAMPIGIDQITNADSIVAEGWAEKVNFDNLKEDELLVNIQKVVENPK
jgi:glucuronosyltransferase